MKKLCDLEQGARFTYGGVEWVKLGAIVAGRVLSLAAEPVFDRAFDEENCNDWRKSSLRRELNGNFLDTLVRFGADRGAFAEFDSDLTADDGMTDYGCATDKIALLSCDLYRKFRAVIPRVENWCWTLTPWTCDPEYSGSVRGVNSSGALNYSGAYNGNGGVRPLCNFESDILVSVPGEEDNAKCADAGRAEAVQDARDDILNTLNDYPAEIWGDALGAAVASLFSSKRDADEITAENETAAEG